MKMCKLAEKWKRRAKMFQKAYQDKDFEVTALWIQKMNLLANGTDKVTQIQNISLREKLLEVCRERNGLKEEVAKYKVTHIDFGGGRMIRAEDINTLLPSPPTVSVKHNEAEQLAIQKTFIDLMERGETESVEDVYGKEVVGGEDGV